MRTGNWTVLKTTEASSCTLVLFDSASTTFVVDNAANTSVFNGSYLFIGTLIDSNVTLATVNGNQGLILNTSPIRIAW